MVVRRSKPHLDASPEATLWAEIGRQLDQMAPAIAQQLGPPPSHSKLSPQQEKEMWAFELTPEHIARAEQGDPTMQRILATLKPRLDQLMQQGAVEEARALARYPFREVLYTSGRPNFKDQVAYAERMARLTGMTEPPPSPGPVAEAAPPPPAQLAPPPLPPQPGSEPVSPQPSINMEPGP